MSLLLPILSDLHNRFRVGYFNLLAHDRLQNIWTYFKHQEPRFRMIMNIIVDAVFRGGFEIHWGDAYATELPPIIHEKLRKFFFSALEHKFMFGFVPITLTNDKETGLIYPVVPIFGTGQFYYGFPKEQPHEIAMTFYPIIGNPATTVTDQNKKYRVFIWPGHEPDLFRPDLIVSQIAGLHAQYMLNQELQGNLQVADFGSSRPTLFIGKPRDKLEEYSPSDMGRFLLSDGKTPETLTDSGIQKWNRAMQDKAISEWEAAKQNATGVSSGDLTKRPSETSLNPTYHLRTQPFFKNERHLVEGEKIDHQLAPKVVSNIDLHLKRYYDELFELFGIPKPAEAARKFKDDAAITEQRFKTLIDNYRLDLKDLWQFVYKEFLKSEGDDMVGSILETLHGDTKKEKTEDLLKKYQANIPLLEEVKQKEKQHQSALVFKESYGRSVNDIDKIEKARNLCYITLEESVKLIRNNYFQLFDQINENKVYKERKTFEKKQKELLEMNSMGAQNQNPPNKQKSNKTTTVSSPEQPSSKKQKSDKKDKK